MHRVYTLCHGGRRWQAIESIIDGHWVKMATMLLKGTGRRHLKVFRPENGEPLRANLQGFVK